MQVCRAELFLTHMPPDIIYASILYAPMVCVCRCAAVRHVRTHMMRQTNFHHKNAAITTHTCQSDIEADQ